VKDRQRCGGSKKRSAAIHGCLDGHQAGAILQFLPSADRSLDLEIRSLRTYPIWQIHHEGPYESVLDVLLAARDLSAEDLSASADGLHPPELLVDLPQAVERIAHAVRQGEKIVVYGDYDVDGVTSTAVLVDFLERAQGDVEAILPDRHADGYGLKPPGIRKALERGAGLVVTVDNGISSYAALELARREGIDVIVTDHHRQTEDLPVAHSIVNPNRRDCTYPFKGLAGVGVAFKVVQALSAIFMEDAPRRAYLNGLLDLVALGTVADVAPVVGENRILIQQGFRVMERGERPGLQQLRTVARSRGSVTTTVVGFILGPRLNAAGRLAHPDLALKLLRAGNEAEAQDLASELDELNTRRRALQRAGVRQARELVVAEDLASDRLLFLLGEGWELGIIGLIASELAQRHHVPTVICTDVLDNGTYVGSARSIEAYDIIAGITSCAGHLIAYGGHAGAAGFSLEAGEFEAFRAALIDHARAHISAEDLTASLSIDMALRSEDIDQRTVDVLADMEPFGPGNAMPTFVARDLEVGTCNRIGRKGEHLKLALMASGSARTAVWWRRGELGGQICAGDHVDVAFTLEEDTYTGNGAVQMVVQDMRAAETDGAA